MGRLFATRRWFAHRFTTACAAAVAWVAIGLSAAIAPANELASADADAALVNPAEELLAPLPEPELQALPLSDVAIDDQVTPAGYYGPSYLGGQRRESANRPVNWISGPYLRSGVTVLIGDDLLGDADGGFTVAGGFRNAVAPAWDEHLFLDFGGSYLSAYGTETRLTPGRLNDVVANVIVDTELVPNAFQTRLDEVKRSSIHGAFGWYWGEPVDDRRDDPQWRLAARLGGRVGHVRARYGSEIRLIAPGANQTMTPSVGITDTFGGLFVGSEAIFLPRRYSFGRTAWTLDAEFATDWIEFGGFGKGNLNTASITLGWMFSR